jgi:GNAT superfamily N-acetyltransferase
MYDRGWLRVIVMRDQIWMCSDREIPAKQKKEVEDTAVESGKRVEIDRQKIATTFPESVSCSGCNQPFHPQAEPEIAMGAVKCPSCGKCVDQHGQLLESDPHEFSDYPKEVVRAAKAVIDWRRKHPAEVRGVTPSAIEIARKLAKREPVGRGSLGKMAAIKPAEPKKEKPWKDADHVLSMLHGGAAGRKWAKRTMATLSESMLRPGVVKSPTVNGQYWLDSTCRWHFCSDDGHEEYASCCLASHGTELSTGEWDTRDIYGDMYKRGWVRVVVGPGTIYGCEAHATRRQIKEIKDAAIETGRKAMWDAGSEAEVSRIFGESDDEIGTALNTLNPQTLHIDKIGEATYGYPSAPSARPVSFPRMWLDDVGKLYKVPPALEHEAWLERRMQKEGKKDAEYRGWARVVVFPKQIVASARGWDRTEVNRSQKAALERMGIELERVVRDTTTPSRQKLIYEPPTLADRLLEVHYTDVYPKGFQQFIKEWRGKKGSYDLYVQFTNKGDVLDRSSVAVPDHQDPTGNYGYPLKYVIDHPADIWYGHGAKYVRVLQDNSRKRLNLSSLNQYTADNLLYKIGSSWSEAAKLFPDKAKGVTAPGKLFFAMLQIDLPKCEFESRGRRRVLSKQVFRSSAEQTKMLLSLGYDAVEDDAKNISQAAINDREPQQIAFLTPTAFKVLASYRMSDPEPGRGTRVSDDNDRLPRRIAALTAAVMGDKIKEHADNADVFWTHAGREIAVTGVDTSLPYRMAHLKIGQKKHKMFRKSNRYRFDVKVSSERGTFSFSIWSDDKVQDGIDQFASQWRAAEGKTDGPRHSKASRAAEKEAAALETRMAEEEAEEAEAAEHWPDICKRYAELTHVAGLKPASLPATLDGGYKKAVIVLENCAAGLGPKSALRFARYTNRAVKEAGLALSALHKKHGSWASRGWGELRSLVGGLLMNMKQWIKELQPEQAEFAESASPLPIGYQIAYNDEFDDESCDFNDPQFVKQLRRIEFESGINVLSCMRLHCVVLKDESPVAALYVRDHGDDFDFDVVVDRSHRKRGIASHLIDLGIAEGRHYVEATGGKIVADVVNPNLIRILKRKGFEVTSVVHNHTNMTLRESLAESLLASYAGERGRRDCGN